VRPLRIFTYRDGNPNAVASIGGKSEPKVTVHNYPRNSLNLGIEVISDPSSGIGAARHVISGGGQAVLPW